MRSNDNPTLHFRKPLKAEHKIKIHENLSNESRKPTFHLKNIFQVLENTILTRAFTYTKIIYSVQGINESCSYMYQHDSCMYDTPACTGTLQDTSRQCWQPPNTPLKTIALPRKLTIDIQPDIQHLADGVRWKQKIEFSVQGNTDTMRSSVQNLCGVLYVS